MYNVICLKWGTKYSSDYVNILYSMVKRNLTIPFKFYCITDDSTGITKPEINIIPIKDENKEGWWYKLQFFKMFELYGIEGINLTLDLDIVIVNNIDCLFENPKKFCISRDCSPAQGNNSSVMLIPQTGYEFVHTEFNPIIIKTQIGKHFMHGDQNWISHKIPTPHLWKKQWIRSYKYECSKRGKDPFNIPHDCRIILFHGKPDPHERLNHIGKYWKD